MTAPPELWTRVIVVQWAELLVRAAERQWAIPDMKACGQGQHVRRAPGPPQRPGRLPQHDVAFDTGLLTVDASLQVHVSGTLAGSTTDACRCAPRSCSRTRPSCRAARPVVNSEFGHSAYRGDRPGHMEFGEVDTVSLALRRIPPAVRPHTFGVLENLDARGLRNHVLIITRHQIKPGDIVQRGRQFAAPDQCPRAAEIPDDPVLASACPWAQRLLRAPAPCLCSGPPR